MPTAPETADVHHSRLRQYAVHIGSRLRIPFISAKVSAGFPSPAEDHLPDMIDLNEHLISNPAATFLVRVEGESMIGAGIFPNDLLIVDRSMEPRNGSVVIAVVDEEMTVKRLVRSKDGVELHSDNPASAPIRLRGENSLEIWGVVRHVIHSP
jgi:DNA polymerase V